MSQSQKRKRVSNPILSLLDLPALQLEQIVHSLPVESLETLRHSSRLLKQLVDTTVNMLHKLYQHEIAQPLKESVELYIKQNPRQSKKTLTQPILTECHRILSSDPDFFHNEYRSLTHIKTLVERLLHSIQRDINILNRSDLTPREQATDQKKIAILSTLVVLLQKIEARLQQLS